MKSVSAVIDRPRATGPSPLWHHLMALSWQKALSLLVPRFLQSVSPQELLAKAKDSEEEEASAVSPKNIGVLWHAGSSSCLRLQRRSAVRVCQAGEGGGGRLVEYALFYL